MYYLVSKLISYFKKESEEEVNDGTTLTETLMVIVPSAFITFIAVLTASLLQNLVGSVSSTQWILFHFTLDFILIVLPLIFTVTVLEQYLIFVIICSVSISVLSAYAFYTKQDSKATLSEHSYSGKRPFITNVRSTISVITAIAILAVDFQVFPARFAKTQKYGYSLMDVGVGLFVFANGIVAPELRRGTPSLMKSINDSFPLLLLGGARYMATQFLNYPVSVSEYGVHWNFFITLAFTKVLSSLILQIVSVKHSFLIATVVLTLHQYLLHIGLQDWVFADLPRTNFITANREGLVSCLGYVGLYFLSVYFGRMYSKTKYNTLSELKLGAKLHSTSVLALCVTLTLERYFGVSRRVANFAYCTWIIFLGVFMSLLFLSAENILKRLYFYKNQEKQVLVPLIYEAVNYNPLPYFLLANVLTGLVNISIKTSTVNSFHSSIILIVYMLMSCACVTLLYSEKVKLKLF